MNFGFAIKTGFVNLKRQKFITFAIVIVIFLIFFLLNLLAGLFYISYKYSKFLQQQQLAVQVFFINDCSPNTDLVNEFVTKVKSYNLHKSFEYYSSKDAHDKRWDELFGNDKSILDSKPDNYCDLLAEFKVNPIDLNSAKTLYENVNELSKSNKYPIYNVWYSQDIQKQWEESITSIQRWLVVAIIFLGVVVFLVVNLLVDVSIRARTDEIGIMQLVGANKNQVRAIFLFEGVLYGLFASFLAVVATLIIYYYCFGNGMFEILDPINNFFREIGIQKMDYRSAFIFILSELLLGIFLGLINNWIAIRKYL